MATEKKTGYSKRPMWQWVVLYVIIAIIVYGLAYHLYFAKTAGYSAPMSDTMAPAMQQVGAPSDNIYLTKTDPTKGSYLTDFNGLTLYTFDKDTAGVSNCYDKCAEAWPVYTSGATAETNLPANITVIKRTDGSTQFAWKGMPLYYYNKDQQAGDLTGDGVGGTWHLVKP